MVYNDFYVGEDCDVDIVAGCGIHNCGCNESRHDGIHTFYVGKNSHVRYIGKALRRGRRQRQARHEPHRPSSTWRRARPSRWRPCQIRRHRLHRAQDEDRLRQGRRGRHHRAPAHPRQTARRERHGRSSSTARMPRGRVISRSVAQDELRAGLPPRGRRQQPSASAMCSATPSSWARPRSSSIPAITANSTDAQLIHEAAIGKIAGDQLLKLETLGLTEEEAEDTHSQGLPRLKNLIGTDEKARRPRSGIALFLLLCWFNR